MFRIFTDNASNLPDELIERWDLGIVPLICSREGEPLDPNGSFDGKTFYGEMREGVVMSTSMPSFGTFLDAFTPVLEKGEDLMYIGMSGGISGTAALARPSPSGRSPPSTPAVRPWARGCPCCTRRGCAKRAWISTRSCAVRRKTATICGRSSRWTI